MSKSKHENYAFIDSQNLNLGVQSMGWRLNFKRFRIYLREKYRVSVAYLFIGYIQENQDLYSALQKDGYILKFKPVLPRKDGSHKGNVDADLVLQAMIDFYEKNFDKAVIVTGDGDFYCLVKYFIEQGKMRAVLIPDQDKFSALLNFKICRPYLRFMNNLEDKLGYNKEKTP